MTSSRVRGDPSYQIIDVERVKPSSQNNYQLRHNDHEKIHSDKTGDYKLYIIIY